MWALSIDGGGLQLRLLVLATHHKPANERTRNDKQDDSRERTVEQPCDANHDERPGKTQHPADDAHTEVHDRCQERHHLEQRGQDAEDALQATHHQQDAQQAQGPLDHVVLVVCALVHLVGTLGAHLQARELLAVLGHILREGVALHAAQNRHHSGVNTGEGDAHVANLGGCGIAIVHHVAIHQVVLVLDRSTHRLGLLLSQDAAIGCVLGLVECHLACGTDDGGRVGHHLVMHGGGVARHLHHGRLAAADAAHEESGELVSAEGHVLGIDGAGFHLFFHRVASLIGRVVEAARVHRTRHPFLLVGVGVDGLLTAAQLVAFLGLLMLHPLVVFYRAADVDSHATHGIVGVAD